MRNHTSVSFRHLAAAVLVVLLVNTQLTWWIVFVLRENRTRLGYEREAIETRCRLEAARLGDDLIAVHMALDAALARDQKMKNAPPAPFTGWRLEASGSACDEPHLIGGVVVFRTPIPLGCAVAPTSPEWTQSLLSLPGDLVIAAGDRGSETVRKPAAAMPPPFADRLICPSPAVWNEILSGYRSRILMMVSEGAFFAVMLFVLVAFVWRTLRREIALEQQHRNFLSAVTHELKSPLAAMRLSLETILRGRADPSTGTHFLENALQDTERLQSLVEKVLEVTRYSRAGGGLHMEDLCVSDVVTTVFQQFSRRAATRGADLDSEIEPNIWVGADAEALSIVLSNLLENALKYGGPTPWIRVRLGCVNGEAALTVEDNGAGIAAAEIPFVFDRFWRSGDEMTRTTEGTGLGLYLVRQIVSSHHGRVSVRATGPDGTTFRVILPGARVVEEAS